MTNSVMLNNVDHGELRVLPSSRSDHGNQLNQTLIFATEFLHVQREYPILFRKNENEEFQAVALLGLDKDENLFLDGEGRWPCRYIPAVQERGPFSIGLKRESEASQDASDALIQVDLDDPRVGAEAGEKLFLPHGGNAPYLEHITRVLKRIHLGIGLTKSMVAAFDEAGLFEEVAVEIKLSDREQYSLPGAYTVSTEKLAALDGAVLEKLNKSGFLMLAFLVVGSLDNIQTLIDLKKRRQEAA